MASLQFPPSFSLPPSHFPFIHHFPSIPPGFSHFSSNPKPFPSPFPSTISSSPPRPISPAAATSFPYSQLQHRQYLKQHDSSNEPRSGDFEEQRNDDVDDDELILGDSVVFEEGAFEEHNPYLPTNIGSQTKLSRKKISKTTSDVETHSLVPEKWKEVVDEINLTKKEKRKIAHQLRFGSRLEGRKKTPGVDIEEYNAYRSMKLSQLNPVVLDNPDRFPAVIEEVGEVSRGRVAPRNPRLEINAGTLEDITEFFNSGNYVPGERYDDKKPQGRRKLFTDEEKVLLNKRIPNLLEATSSKWLPLHALASSGEFYLLDLLLKHNVDINAVDEGGLAAIHKAILSKKHAITSYLLRNSANPFVRDMDDATLMHYAVLTASSASIKLLLLYNVDINRADNDGWTPLHLAVQTQRTDIVRLLLIKGADRTLKNQEGLTPLDMCLYCGHNVRTYEIIKLLKDTKSMSQYLQFFRRHAWWADAGVLIPVRAGLFLHGLLKYADGRIYMFQ